MATQGQISLGDYLRVIFKRKALIIGVFLIISLGIGLAVFRQPTLYEVSGKLLVTRSRADLVLTPSAPGSSNAGFILPQQQDMTAEVELLKGRALAKAVIETLGLYRPVQASADKVPVMLAGLMPLPTSLTSWLPPWLGGAPTNAAENERSGPEPLDRMAAGIQRGLTVQVIPNSNVIEVRYRSTDPERSVNVVNTLLKLYLDRYLEIHRPPGVTAFLAEQLQRYEQKLRESEDAMRRFEGRTTFVNAANQMEVYSRQLAEAEQTLMKTRYDILDKQQKLSSMKAYVSSVPERLITSQQVRHNPLIETLQMRLLEMEMEREKLLQSYTEQDRRVHEINERMAIVRQRLGEQPAWVPSSETSQLHPLRQQWQESMLTTQTSLDRLKIDQQEATEQFARLKHRIGEIAQYAVDGAELTREVKANEEAYLLYRKKVEEARISQAMDEQKIVNVTIAEGPAIPIAPITSKGLSYAFALIVGLVAGVGGGFLREFVDDSVKTAADVTSGTALPVLASIPEEKPNGKKNGGHTGRS
jgi:succinoglycan biosynthesis transport protein ExoP